MGRGRRKRILAIALVLALLAGAGTLLALPRGATAQDAETRTLSLDEGWNLAGWTGPDTPLADAILDIVDVIVTAAAFDTAQEAFRTWNATAPPFLNSLDTLRQGQAVWVLVTAPISWVQPVVADPGPLALDTGFNLLTWMGPSGLEPTETFGAIASALDVAFAFDKPAETFTSFGPTRPDFLNNLAPLRYGDGFWVRMDAPATWTQPAPSPPAAIAADDGSATLVIPPGALPAGVSAGDISLTNISNDPAAIVVEEGTLLAAYELAPAGLALPAPVTLRIPLAIDDGALVEVIHFADGDAQIVQAVSIDVDPDTGATVVAADIEGFSRVTVIQGSHTDLNRAAVSFDQDPTDVGHHALGADFSIELGAHRNEYIVINSVRSETPTEPGGTQITEIFTRARPEGSWAVDAGYTVRPPHILAPSFVNGLESEVLGDAGLLTRETFTCVGVGEFSIFVGVFAQLSQRVEMKKWIDGELLVDVVFTSTGYGWVGGTVRGECVTGEPVGSMAFISDSGQFSETILIGTGMEVLVQDPTTPLTNPGRFPITVVVRVNGVLQQTVVIDGDPANVCANANVCSTHMDAIDADPGDTVEITATDAKGDVVAHQSHTVP